MKDCALAIVLDSRNEAVLLVQRRDLPVWVLPGGGIDDDESPERAVVREVFEETGLHVVISRKTAEYLPINRLTSRVHVFICETRGGQLSTGAESRQVGFFPLDCLPKPFFPYHSEWLKEGMGSCQPICRPMSRKTFLRILFLYAFHPLIASRYLFSKMGYPINS